MCKFIILIRKTRNVLNLMVFYAKIMLAKFHAFPYDA